ncbi:MAG TPA: hypothetical protein PLY34_08045 [Ferruginibacter sp.]|nr:hypothetical protein [Ferruginibacter sp.]HPH91384.1 hypothetical protein [Ferruginibacter sp.]
MKNGKGKDKKKLSKKEEKLFIEKEWLATFFGKFKGEFGDGVEYQRKLRDT